MSSRTIFLGKLLGLYLVLATLPLIAGTDEMARVKAMISDAPALFLLGTVTLAAGLAFVLGHNRWSGGALPVIVTICGWLTLIKGFLFFIVTPELIAEVMAKLHYAKNFRLYALPALLVGIYLTCASFIRKASSQ